MINSGCLCLGGWSLVTFVITTSVGFMIGSTYLIYLSSISSTTTSVFIFPVKEEFLINKDYDLKLRNKIGAFKEETNFKKSIQLVMITTFGVKKNKYSSIVQNQVVLDDLFKK